MTYCTITRVLAALFLIVPLAACDGSGQPATRSNSADATEQTATVAVGATGKANGVDITVTGVTTPKQIGPAGIGPKAEKGETFVVVSYTIKNTSKEALSLMERPALSLVDASGQTYAQDNMASPVAAAMMTDVSGMAADLNRNVSAKTKAAWKVDAATFNRGTWRLVAATDPQLTFALK